MGGITAKLRLVNKNLCDGIFQAKYHLHFMCESRILADATPLLALHPKGQGVTVTGERPLEECPRTNAFEFLFRLTFYVYLFIRLT